MSTMIGLAAMTAMTMAQSVTTHSVYDVNQNGEVNVADAVSVAQATLQEVDPEQTLQNVSANELNAVLTDIYQLLGKLDQKLNYVMRESGINYPYPDDNGIITNGYEYVDLGVVVDGKPVYWATTNVGAVSPADYGLYFAWGETVGYGSTPQGKPDPWGAGVEILDGRKFDWASYSSDLCEGDYDKMKKYCTDSEYGTVDNKTVLAPEDDAAHVNWQGAWRMPTEEELSALRTQCTWEWTSMTNSERESVDGYKVSNKTDSSKSIFLPASGRRSEGNLYHARSGGSYLSRSLNTSNNSVAFCLEFGSAFYDLYSRDRSSGLPVRPVCQ